MTHPFETATQASDHLVSSDRPASRGGLWALSIEHRIYLVGAVPIIVAVLIGIVSLYLLDRADTARRGAHTVATVFRHVVTGMNERDAFIAAVPERRDSHLRLALSAIDAATDGVDTLDKASSEEASTGGTDATLGGLERYRAQMTDLAPAIRRSDALLEDMDKRLASFLTLTDEARQRQHASNVDIVESLRERDAILSESQERLADAHRTRSSIVDFALEGRADAGAESFSVARIGNAVDAMTSGLSTLPASERAAFETAVGRFLENGETGDALAFIDRRIKIDGTLARSLQNEVGELLTYTVEAHETEQATQNVAVETVKLAGRTREAVEHRDLDALDSVQADSDALGERIADLPISPLIQTEMLDALDRWRQGLEKARAALADQEQAISAMNITANALVLEVANLNSDLSSRADRIGTTARRTLVLGAGIALFFAAFFGLIVGRSITRPLKTLEAGMLDRAESRENLPLPGASRRDEIGLMTRATNQFLDEIKKREAALRAAKTKTEDALERLQRTQSELIQSEKLASLGQLVAGVAHEINTPLGVALTTTSVLKDEVRKFGDAATQGQVTKQSFEIFIDRVGDGMRLTVANLERAARLVASFKQVSTDQTNDELRRVRLAAFLDEVFTSLGPLGRKGGHRVEVRCPDLIELDTYPGALAQVLTNLLTNAYAHGFGDRKSGHVQVSVESRKGGGVSIAFADDGAGIEPAVRRRIFDPFVTTGRAKGSTGLGLHIVHNIVTGILGGRIDVESERGKGTCIEIDLPAAPPTREPQKDLNR
ncbi:ATP-binding protein [Fulvimarina sp. 2208YS6-2-32]|uniref:histidine kinase n=1 Tax=Fulvimarina uroteuthidis TaxID=3098149 RepID=A0ABU5I7I8_9HYPH|nr:ATP-binding protein [Fulvimarina sp. 2208YS6-2-32]MDY8110166.1 ATP-binding protein [Fulvimarina sp. 2208YS6-2-32]